MAEFIPGVNDLASLLEFLKDNKQAAQQIKQLQALSDEIALQLEIKGTIEEIKALRGQAERDRAQAREELSSARVEAEQLRAVLAQERKDCDTQCQLSLARVTDEHDRLKVQRTLADDALRAREIELVRQQDLLAERASRVSEKEAWVEKTIQEYRERLGRLKEFASTV